MTSQDKPPARELPFLPSFKIGEKTFILTVDEHDGDDVNGCATKFDLARVLQAIPEGERAALLAPYMLRMRSAGWPCGKRAPIV